MPGLTIRLYVDRDGRAPFQTWLDSRDAQAQAKINVVLSRLGQGNRSQAKGLGGGLAELKLDWGPGYRIYFGQDGETLVILLAGGTKKRQDDDIDAARLRWADYKSRKKMGQ